MPGCERIFVADQGIAEVGWETVNDSLWDIRGHVLIIAPRSRNLATQLLPSAPSQSESSRLTIASARSSASPTVPKSTFPERSFGQW